MLPLLFSITLVCWTMSSFSQAASILTLVATSVMQLVFFAFFMFVNARKTLKVAIFISVTFIYFCIIVLFSLAIGYITGKSYIIWLIASSPDDPFTLPFCIISILVFSYIISAMVFYFTNVNFRIVGLFLIGVIPLLLQSAKTSKDLTFWFIFFVIIFFVMYVERTRIKGIKGVYSILNDRWYFASILLFLSISLFLAVITPKPYTVPKIIYVDQVLEPFKYAVNQAIQNQNGNLNMFNPMENKSESYINSTEVPTGEKILYEIEADEPLYMRVRSWDNYNKNKWTKKTTRQSALDDAVIMNKMEYDSFISLLQKKKDNGVFKTKYTEVISALNYPNKSQKTNNLIVKNFNYFQNYFLNPPGVEKFIRYGSEKRIYQVMIGEDAHCVSNQNPAQYEEYKIIYKSQQLTPNSREFKVLKIMNKELLDSIISLSETNETEEIFDQEERFELSILKMSTQKVYEKYTTLPKDFSPRIYNLAKNITKGKKSDYDKAMAIQNYFVKNNYEYSLKIPKADKYKDYNEYFLFESKKGVCVQFASSMVLLARACGLPARYVEGFVADEYDYEKNRYLIREIDSHAFPEVYIAGYGWLVFEPTLVAESSNKFGELIEKIVQNIIDFFKGLFNMINELPVWIKIIFIPVFILVFIILVRAYFIIKKNIWRFRLTKCDNKKAIEEIFKRSIHLLKKIGLEIDKSETPARYNERVKKQSGIVISELVEIFNNSKYAGVMITNEDINKAFENYKVIEFNVKRRLGKIKSFLM